MCYIGGGIGHKYMREWEKNLAGWYAPEVPEPKEEGEDNEDALQVDDSEEDFAQGDREEDEVEADEQEDEDVEKGYNNDGGDEDDEDEDDDEYINPEDLADILGFALD